MGEKEWKKSEREGEREREEEDKHGENVLPKIDNSTRK